MKIKKDIIKIIYISILLFNIVKGSLIETQISNSLIFMLKNIPLQSNTTTSLSSTPAPSLPLQTAVPLQTLNIINVSNNQTQSNDDESIKIVYSSIGGIVALSLISFFSYQKAKSFKLKKKEKMEEEIENRKNFQKEKNNIIEELKNQENTDEPVTISFV